MVRITTRTKGKAISNINRSSSTRYDTQTDSMDVDDDHIDNPEQDAQEEDHEEVEEHLTNIANLQLNDRRESTQEDCLRKARAQIEDCRKAARAASLLFFSTTNEEERQQHQKAAEHAKKTLGELESMLAIYEENSVPGRQEKKKQSNDMTIPNAPLGLKIDPKFPPYTGDRKKYPPYKFVLDVEDRIQAYVGKDNFRTMADEYVKYYVRDTDL
ncbi:hypothetical protein BGW38_009805, partial [Lunasporangiospora selenospora]